MWKSQSSPLLFTPKLVEKNANSNSNANAKTSDNCHLRNAKKEKPAEWKMPNNRPKETSREPKETLLETSIIDRHLNRGGFSNWFSSFFIFNIFCLFIASVLLS